MTEYDTLRARIVALATGLGTLLTDPNVKAATANTNTNYSLLTGPSPSVPGLRDLCAAAKVVQASVREKVVSPARFGTVDRRHCADCETYTRRWRLYSRGTQGEARS
jgi:hypothetical protein